MLLATKPKVDACDGAKCDGDEAVVGDGTKGIAQDSARGSALAERQCRESYIVDSTKGEADGVVARARKMLLFVTKPKVVAHDGARDCCTRRNRGQKRRRRCAWRKQKHSPGFGTFHRVIGAPVS